MTDQRSKLSDLPPPETDKVRDLLFGPDLDIDEIEAEQILESYNLNSEEIIDEFKLLLEGRIKINTSEGKEQENENLEFFLKDISKYQKARSPAAVEPKSWIK